MEPIEGGRKVHKICLLTCILAVACAHTHTHTQPLINEREAKCSKIIYLLYDEGNVPLLLSHTHECQGLEMITRAFTVILDALEQISWDN